MKERGPRLPTVFVELPACHQCDSVKLDIGGGTVKQGDGSIMRYARCLDCGLRQRIVFESPHCGIEFGGQE